MTDTLDYPREYDAVLGEDRAKLGAVVLGGLQGVKHRLTQPDEALRIAALIEAARYGLNGTDLIIQALNDHSAAIQKTAYTLLRDRQERKCQQALREFNPYPLLSCVHTVKSGSILAVSSDAEAIASRQSDCSIKVWDALTEETHYVIPKHNAGFFKTVALDETGTTLIRVLARKRNGVGSVAEVWQEGELQFTLVGHEDEISAIAISPDGHTLATGSHDKTIKLWNLDNGKLLCTFCSQLFVGTHSEAVAAVTFSHDGEQLISSSHDRTIKVWNLRNRERPRTLCQRITAVQSIVVTPNGKAIATVSWDRIVRLWDLGSGDLLKTFEGHIATVSAIAFSPDGKVLISASSDRTIKLWDAETGKLGNVLEGHTEAIEHLAISSDGHKIVTSSSDKILKIWGINNA
jgi:COMPASS component SWD3